MRATLASLQRSADRVEMKLGHLHKLIYFMFAKEQSIMPTLDDIKAQADAILAKATANTDALSSIAGVINDQKVVIADLKAQLDAALAAGDPVKIAEASAALDQGIGALDAGAAAEAALAGTPAAPQP